MHYVNLWGAHYAPSFSLHPLDLWGTSRGGGGAEEIRLVELYMIPQCVHTVDTVIGVAAAAQHTDTGYKLSGWVQIVADDVLLSH